MSPDALVGLASMGMAISDATKKPDVPELPSETNLKSSLEEKKRVARAQGLSSTLIAGRSRSPLGIPGGGTAPVAA